MSEGLENSKEFVFENERTEMILHQQAPNPWECVKPLSACKLCEFLQNCRDKVDSRKCDRPLNVCKSCEFLQICREKALILREGLDKKTVMVEAGETGLGSLALEENGYTPDLD